MGWQGYVKITAILCTFYLPNTIYALESYTQIVNENTNHLDLTALSSTDIDDHLFIQRLQANLSNLRFAYGQMQGYEDSGYLDLIEEYRNQIKDLTTKLKDLRNNYKKIDSV